MGLTQRQAVTKTIAVRYKRASQVEKGTILDELCATTGWHRNHARKAPGQGLRPMVVRPRRPRVPKYGGGRRGWTAVLLPITRRESDLDDLGRCECADQSEAVQGSVAAEETPQVEFAQWLAAYVVFRVSGGSRMDRWQCPGGCRY